MGGDALKKSFLILMCLDGDDWCTFFNSGKQINFLQSLQMSENFLLKNINSNN